MSSLYKNTMIFLIFKNSFLMTTKWQEKKKDNSILARSILHVYTQICK